MFEFNEYKKIQHKINIVYLFCAPSTRQMQLEKEENIQYDYDYETPTQKEATHTSEYGQQEFEDRQIYSANYINQLTLDTMVNRDILRKINEKKAAAEAASTENWKLCWMNVQEISKELWDITKQGEMPVNLNSGFPYELQKTFNQYVSQCREYLEKHPSERQKYNSMATTATDAMDNCQANSYPKKEESGKKEGGKPNEVKQIEMEQVYMQKQHPLWNYNHFNRKNAKHAYPPNSQYHIPTTQPITIWKPPVSNWRHDAHNDFRNSNMLFGDIENV